MPGERGWGINLQNPAEKTGKLLRMQSTRRTHNLQQGKQPKAATAWRLMTFIFLNYFHSLWKRHHQTFKTAYLLRSNGISAPSREVKLVSPLLYSKDFFSYIDEKLQKCTEIASLQTGLLCSTKSSSVTLRISNTGKERGARERHQHRRLRTGSRAGANDWFHSCSNSGVGLASFSSLFAHIFWQVTLT